MSMFANMSPSTRRSALAVMMLAILLLGTAGAWVIVIAGETWYLITSGDTPIGWHVSQQETLPNGDGRGYDIIYTLVGDGSSMRSFSVWRLNAAATKGRYASESVRSGRRRTSSTGVTHVKYDHPIVGIRLER